jgi:FkbM family methyltransferase
VYYAEYGQDKWLFENIFCDKENGQFIEAGALNGLQHSNTLFFERERGWQGVLIEPNEMLYKECKQNRDSLTLNVGLAGIPMVKEFTEVIGDKKGWSYIDTCDRHMERIKDNKLDTIKKNVNCITLNDVCEYLPGRIDLLSLDIEGMEYDVLRNFNFKKYDIHCILIENQYNDERLNALLNKHRYFFIERIAIDDVYVKVALNGL